MTISLDVLKTIATETTATSMLDRAKFKAIVKLLDNWNEAEKQDKINNAS